MVEFLDFRTSSSMASRCAGRLLWEIRTCKLDLIVTSIFAPYFPGGFVNQADHRAVDSANLDARVDAGNRWIFPGLVDEGPDPGCRGT